MGYNIDLYSRVLEAENELFAANYNRIMPWLESAQDRMPILGELGIRREIHGAADISMREFDPRRFGSYADSEHQEDKAPEVVIMGTPRPAVLPEQAAYGPKNLLPRA